MITKYLSPIILILSLIIASVLFIDISKTQKSFLENQLLLPLMKGKKAFEKSIEPIIKSLEIMQAQINHLEVKSNNYYDESWVIKRFAPIVENIDGLSSLGIANESGYEIDLLYVKKNNFNCRKVFLLDGEKTIVWSNWELTQSGWEKISQKQPEKTTINPQFRTWFKGAINNDIYITNPYPFNTNNELGLTIAKSFYTSKLDSRKWVLAFDVSLENLSYLLSSQKLISNSSLFILDDKLQIVGVSEFNKEDSSTKLLESYQKYNNRPFKNGIEEWVKSNRTDKEFDFSYKGSNYKGLISPAGFISNRTMYFGIVISEKEALIDINRSKKNILIGLIVIVFLTFINSYNNVQVKKYFNLLKSKTRKIAQQGRMIGKKNEDIHESMMYASRIQQSVMPNSNQLKKSFLESFVIFQPLEQVGGDFLWTTKTNGYEYLAVADCTGHGIPGSLVSMVGIRSLDQSVYEFDLFEPSKILDKSSEIIEATFSRYGSSITDGMDASLMAIKNNKNGSKTLLWSGANNPIIIISKKSSGVILPEDFNSKKDRYIESEDNQRYLVELHPNRQPIGYFADKEPFKLRKMSLRKGAIIYLFTDGIVDQFGGEKGKKLMISRLRRKLLEWSALNLKEQEENLREFLNNWMVGFDQVDDIAFVGIKI